MICVAYVYLLVVDSRLFSLLVLASWYLSHASSASCFTLGLDTVTACHVYMFIEMYIYSALLYWISCFTCVIHALGFMILTSLLYVMSLDLCCYIMVIYMRLPFGHTHIWRRLCSGMTYCSIMHHPAGLHAGRLTTPLLLSTSPVTWICTHHHSWVSGRFRQSVLQQRLC